MPITKSAKKALRQSRRRAKHNLAQKTQLKKALKTAKPASIPKVVSAIDKAAKKGLIHPNKASRLKSQLAKKVGVIKSKKPIKKTKK